MQDSPVDETGAAGSDSAGTRNFAGASGSGQSGAPAGHAGSGVSGSSTGGKTGAAGSGGKAGATGSAGSAGSGGKAGASAGGAANGGSAGASNGGTTGVAGSPANGGSAGSPTVAGFSVQYKNAITNSSSAYIGAEILVNNAGPNSLAISELKLRYYFTDEPKKASQMTINFAHVKLSGNQANLTVNAVFTGMAPTAPTADTFIDFSFSAGSHPALGPGEALDFAWQMQGPDPSKDTFNQANDYSWDASKTSMTNWEHIVLLQGTNPLWGTPP